MVYYSVQINSFIYTKEELNILILLLHIAYYINQRPWSPYRLQCTFRGTRIRIFAIGGKPEENPRLPEAGKMRGPSFWSSWRTAPSSSPPWEMGSYFGKIKKIFLYWPGEFLPAIYLIFYIYVKFMFNTYFLFNFLLFLFIYLFIFFFGGGEFLEFLRICSHTFKASAILTKVMAFLTDFVTLSSSSSTFCFLASGSPDPDSFTKELNSRYWDITQRLKKGKRPTSVSWPNGLLFKKIGKKEEKMKNFEKRKMKQR